MTHTFRRCAHCGSERNPAEAKCASCGSRVIETVRPPVARKTGNKPAPVLLRFAVWLLLGLFGGYAYWTGNKIKAYARAALWVAAIGWIMLGVSAHRAEQEAWSFSFGFAFLANLLLILVLWVFDLAHLLSRSRASR